MKRYAISFFVAAALACGGSTTTLDGGTPTDASGDTAGDGGCIRVSQEGTPCVAGQRSCDRVDLCCASAFTCNTVTNTWKLEGLACLQCQSHPCGSKTCQGGEMCVQRQSGIDGGSTTYDCAPYPTACAREWTCGCVQQNLPPNCTLTPNGCTDGDLVTLTCMGA